VASDRDALSLSPFLFAIAINELSITLNQALQDANLQGVSLGHNCPPIHSLLFADDLILCGAANMQEAIVLKNILDDFCAQLGQIPNFNKSAILFSRNVDDATRTNIKNVFPVPDLLPNTIHLGHPLIFTHRDKNRAYSFIYNKFLPKLTTVKANKINHPGRLAYIQTVLSSIPIYYMSTIIFSKTFIDKIITVMRRFWWGGVLQDDPSNPIAYRSWEDICQSKENGGLGIRDLHLVNKSLVIHTAYNIANSKDPFLSAVLKSKYYPHNSFFLEQRRRTARHLIKEEKRYKGHRDPNKGHRDPNDTLIPHNSHTPTQSTTENRIATQRPKHDHNL